VLLTYGVVLFSRESFGHNVLQEQDAWTNDTEPCNRFPFAIKSNDFINTLYSWASRCFALKSLVQLVLARGHSPAACWSETPAAKELSVTRQPRSTGWRSAALSFASLREQRARALRSYQQQLTLCVCVCACCKLCACVCVLAPLWPALPLVRRAPLLR